MNLRVISGVLLAGAVLAAGGCEKMAKIPITQYPEFWDGSIKVIAVTKFRNSTRVPGLDDAVSDALAAGLDRNGTYKVYNRGYLKTVVDERDMIEAYSGNASKMVAKLKGMTDVQAILVGNVVNCSTRTTNTPKRETYPNYQYNPYTKQMEIAGYSEREYVVTRNEVVFEVTASLIRIVDGQTIYSTPGVVGYTNTAEGSPPQYDCAALLANAKNLTIGALVKTFAVTSQVIELDMNKSFRTAVDFYDGEFKYTNRLKAADKKNFIVVTLPESCDRNRFRITAVRKDERNDLLTMNIVWSAKKAGCMGYEFNPSKLAQDGGGPGKYVFKFYSGQTPVMTHEFEIQQ
ncbi:MAG: hypothetical protein HZA50_12550 [Planctomycetes bacterium]|nr:hypothetical protein [Planctomycetota bacterium]